MIFKRSEIRFQVNVTENRLTNTLTKTSRKITQVMPKLNPLQPLQPKGFLMFSGGIGKQHRAVNKN